MPTEIVEGRAAARSQSPSGAQRILRGHLALLRDLSTAEEAGRAGTAHNRGRRPAPGGVDPLPAFSPSEVQVVLQQLRAFQDEWVQRDAFARQPLPDERVPLPQPPHCPFLTPGQTFAGSQRVTHWTPGKGEAWDVRVSIQGYDPAAGRLCGVMTALDVPEAAAPVVTFFEGEIVDNVNASFYTSHADWAALAETDLRHWARFPAFRGLRRDVERYGGRAPGLADCGCVFMRWKEQFFIAGGECRLTIAGHYYVCMDRATGKIEALYFDPASSPDQRLQLTPCLGGEAGHAFAAHELA